MPPVFTPVPARRAPRWQRVVARTALCGQLLLGSTALLTLTLAAHGAAATDTATQTVWTAPYGPVPTTWSPALARRFPGCDPALRLRPPASVVEVDGAGIPVRVGFADAWRREHDRVRGNSGRVLAECRS